MYTKLFQLHIHNFFFIFFECLLCYIFFSFFLQINRRFQSISSHESKSKRHFEYFSIESYLLERKRVSCFFLLNLMKKEKSLFLASTLHYTVVTKISDAAMQYRNVQYTKPQSDNYTSKQTQIEINLDLESKKDSENGSYLVT